MVCDSWKATLDTYLDGELPSEEMRAFDVYRGDQVGEGRKSLALRLSFRAADRTLTDEEVAERLGLATGSIGFIRGRCLKRLQRALEESGF